MGCWVILNPPIRINLNEFPTQMFILASDLFRKTYLRLEIRVVWGHF